LPIIVEIGMFTGFNYSVGEHAGGMMAGFDQPKAVYVKQR
jgi:hypothetical protein